MKVYILYNRGTDYMTRMDQLKEELTEASVPVDMIDADSTGGIQLAQTYDLMGRPSVVVAEDDGTVVFAWQGIDSLPALQDITYLAHQ